MNTKQVECTSKDITAAAAKMVEDLDLFGWEYFGFDDVESYDLAKAIAKPCEDLGDGECPWWSLCETYAERGRT